MTEDPDEVNDETLPTVATVHVETQTDEQMTQPSGFLSYTLIKDSDERTSYYTGLEKYALFNIILAFLYSSLPQPRTYLCKADELLLVLMKLRLNLQLQDLAYRVQVSVGTVSNIFHRWVDAINIRLRFLMAWPAKEIVLHNMPPLIQELPYGPKFLRD